MHRRATSEEHHGDNVVEDVKGPHVPCPTCRTPVAWRGNPQRPFCSLTCRLIDLGLWLDGRYRIESDDRSSDDPLTA
jgi:endogenous inhibitor of DNA gyrase (YacG/DUF329 family)